MTPAVILPSREPDAIAREAENLRRARTVFASGRRLGGAAFHAATLTPAPTSVIHKPHPQIRRGA